MSIVGGCGGHYYLRRTASEQIFGVVVTYFAVWPKKLILDFRLEKKLTSVEVGWLTDDICTSTIRAHTDV